MSAPAVVQSDAAAKAAAAQAQAALMAQQAANDRALYLGRKSEVVMPPQIGPGPGQTYQLGTTMVWNLPTKNGGFLEDIFLYFSIVVNMAAGTSATYGLNPSAPFSLISMVELEYGQSQFKIPLHILRNWYQLQGAAAPTIGQVLLNSDSAVQALLYNSPFGVATGNNTWTFSLVLPMRWLTRDIAGMLPIMGSSTPGQLRLTVPSAIMGNDPVLFPTRATGGTGNAVTITSGTITAYARFRNGLALSSPKANFAPADVDKLPTAQMKYDSTLQPLAAGIRNPIRITTKEQHWYVISVVVDAQQSTNYALWSNLAAIELDQDFSGDNAFIRYGSTAVNLPVYLWMQRQREMLFQDYVDEGIIPWIAGPVENTYDPDLRDGKMFLEMRPGNWTDATIAVVPTAVGAVAGVTPRIDNYVFFKNFRGLQKKGN